MADLRLFFSLWPDPSTAVAISEVMQQQDLEGRLVARERLHMTLVFLGHVDSDRLPFLFERAASVRMAPFSLQLDHVGHFARPGITWLGPSVAPPELLQLADTLAGSTGWMTNYRPHVSLARRSTAPEPGRPVKPVSWHVTRFCLVESGHNGRPGQYKTLGQWPLGTQ